jgi:hypothetical protein
MGLSPGITAQSEETERKQNQIHLCAFFAILLLGLTVRLIYIFQPMRYDEAFSFTNYASTPLSLALSSYSYPNNHLFHTLLNPRLGTLRHTSVPTLPKSERLARAS